MPKRKGGPAPTDKAAPEQYARFVEAARELECDDDPAVFDRMFERVVPPRRKPEEPAPTNATADKP
jgi:hypothetical protein